MKPQIADESMPFDYPDISEDRGGEPLNTSDPMDFLYQGKPNERQRTFILDDHSNSRPSGGD